METWVAVVIGTVLIAGTFLGVLLIVLITRQDNWRAEQLRRRGVKVQARVIEVEESQGNAEWGEKGDWGIRYQFRDPQTGQEQTGWDYLTGIPHQPLRAGEIAVVVYLPEKPWVSGLVCNCLVADIRA